MDCARYYDTVGAPGGLREIEMNRFGQVLPYIDPSGTLHDAACGAGYWLDFLGERTELSLSGSDVSPVRLGAAKELLDGKDISLEVADITRLPYADGSFGQVTAMEVLEHIPDWKAALKEVVRIASGQALITVPYKEKLLYEPCPSCGNKASLYGHLHSLSEESFEEVGVDGKVSYAHLRPPHFGYYMRLGLKVIGKNMTRTESQKSGISKYTVCDSCYAEVPYERYMEKAMERLKKMIRKSPEYLLVRIER